MKKILLAVILLTAAQAVFAGGSMAIAPSTVARDTNQVAFTMNFYPGSGDAWSSGSLAFTVPEGFNPEPLTITAYQGQVSVVIMRNGLTQEPVPPGSIYTSGRAVTITALTLGSNDYVIIYYGYIDAGSYILGLNSPMVQGVYVFTAYEAPGGTGYIALVEQPFVLVNSAVLEKSASVTNVSAGLTFTYTLSYYNLSTYHTFMTTNVWDSLPAGIIPVGSNLPFAAQTDTYVSWNVGYVSSAGNGSIQLYCIVQPGIRKTGAEAVNKAGIYASDGYTGGEYYAFSEAAVNNYGPILGASLYSTPSYVTEGQYITVIMTVSNSGNSAANNVSPDPSSGNSGTASVSWISGPQPAAFSILNPATSTHFTWVYKSTGSGSFSFTGKATAFEGIYQITTGSLSSNQVTVNPAPTHTWTFTTTPTATPTITRTNTEEPTADVTDVPAYTFTVTRTNTKEPTATKTIAVPTNTPVVIPAFVAGGNVYTDKNYIKSGSEENFIIYYEAPAAGKLKLTVFNLSGEKIRYFERDYAAKTMDYMSWDGRNEALKPVGKGIYFINVKMGSWQKIKKVVILK